MLLRMIKGDVGEWVYTANIGPLPGTQVKIPVPFVTSKVDGSLMHAVQRIGTQIPQLQHAAGARAKLAVEVFIRATLSMLTTFLRPLHITAHFVNLVH